MREAVVLAWLLWLYDDINNLSPLRVAAALGHARMWWHVEADLHVAVERSINVALTSHHLVAVILGNYYDNAHFVVTFGALGWLWLRHPTRYPAERRALVLINLIGCVCFFVYPMAPPRMLPGFMDTVAASHAIGSWHSGGLAAVANQYAAMPSLHLAWAVWSAVVLYRYSRRVWIRIAACVYPALTFVAVIATANHLLVDSLAGVATAGLAFAVEASATRRVARWRSRAGRRLEPVPANALVTRPLDGSGSRNPVVVEHVVGDEGW